MTASSHFKRAVPVDGNGSDIDISLPSALATTETAIDALGFTPIRVPASVPGNIKAFQAKITAGSDWLLSSDPAGAEYMTVPVSFGTGFSAAAGDILFYAKVAAETANLELLVLW